MPARDARLVTPALLRDWPLPAPGQGKEQRGAVVVLGGTVHTPGAVRLAGEAALRAGAGKLVLATAAANAPGLGVQVPECLSWGLPTTAGGNLEPEAVGDELGEQLEGAGAVVAGPGLSDPEASVRLVEHLLGHLRGPVVVDALASAYLTEHPEGLAEHRGDVVLTVNPVELGHTAGQDVGDVEADPRGAARVVAERSGVVVLCGGAVKHVVDPDGQEWTVEGGGPGLGVSGSGDVQAGIVGGLLARGADGAQAAVWGAYLHARAGERRASEGAAVGYLARELLPEVPRVLAELRDR